MYALKEGYDGGFLRNHFKTKDGNFYDGGFLTDIDQELKVDPGKDDVEPQSELKALLAAAGEADPTKRFAAMSKVLDVPKFVSYLCLQLLTCDWDGYPLKKNNYRIFHNPLTGKLVFIPSGMDQTFDQTDLPLLPKELQGVVAQRLMETPEGRRRYLTRMMELLRNVFPVARMMAWVDGMAPKLQNVLRPLDAGQANELPNQVRQLRDSIKNRAASIEDQLRSAR